jgi:uncharacterized protein
MRIAVDIDSTLHHHWEVLSEVSVRRFGVELPYEEQLTWGLTRLRPDQFALCVQESHSDERILAGVPYQGAAEALRGWHEGGHGVHVICRREAGRHAATAAWLQGIGLPFDGLHCTSEKVELCLELGIGLLIDDSPMHIRGAVEHGILAATILHPWNQEVCEEEDVVCAGDWPQLAMLLEPVLGWPAHLAREQVGSGRS